MFELELRIHTYYSDEYLVSTNQSRLLLQHFVLGTGDLDSVGSGKGRYHCINVPLSDGIRDEQYEKIFKRSV